MPKKTTMSDIAAELGISTVTVSKALSGQKGVSEEMRQRIMEIAEERGYQKSSSAKDVESFKIGILIGSRYLGNIDSFYGHMYQIFSAKAAKMGSFTMLEVLAYEDEKNLEHPKLIGDGNVDAIVIMGALSEEYLQMLDEKLATPVFYMDFSDRKHQKDSVISGSFYGAYILTNYLFDKGHTDIGYVGTILATPSITDRYLGYVRALMEHGIEIKKEMAGLMLSAIISDTLLYRSPTCTDTDKKAGSALAAIAGVNEEELAKSMFTAGSNLGGKTPEEILHQDFKKFNVVETNVGIGQISSMSSHELSHIKEAVLPVLEASASKDGLDMIMFMLTDILKESSEVIFFGQKAEITLENGFGVTSKDHTSVNLPGVVSRKKQMLPTIINTLEQ